jgi:hypothetical protein
MGWLDNTGDDVRKYWPSDPVGSPGFQGSDSPLDLLTGKTKAGPVKPSTANLDEQMGRANSLGDQLAGERAGYATHYNPGRDDMLAVQQNNNISDLSRAAAGKVASPAEIQLQKMAGMNAARQFGLAAALQGRNPGAAMRSARLGSIATQAATNVDAATLRAQEEQAARNQLIQALASARGQGQNLLSLDNGAQNALLQAQLEALGIGTKAAGAQFDAENKNAAAQNQFDGNIMNMFGGMIKSDRTAKTDIKPRDLTKLAGAIKGYGFRYKDPADGPGERVGVMAQDVAKGGPAGKLIVRRGPGRKLHLDVGNAIGAALAMSAQALRESRKAA